ncbi:hypothetical protein ACPA9J_00140 [Pseudomonas aeruginosa]
MRQAPSRPGSQRRPTPGQVAGGFFDFAQDVVDDASGARPSSNVLFAEPGALALQVQVVETEHRSRVARRGCA